MKLPVILFLIKLYAQKKIFDTKFFISFYMLLFSPVKEVSEAECKEIDELLQYLSEEHTLVKMKKQVCTDSFTQIS